MTISKTLDVDPEQDRTVGEPTGTKGQVDRRLFVETS
jgi:hypothetical protein